MNKKLAILSLTVVVGLAIISVSHLVDTSADNFNRTITEVESLTINNANDKLVRSPQSISVATMSEAEETESIEPEIIFQEINDTVYTTEVVNLRTEPDVNSEVHSTVNYRVDLNSVVYS